MKIQRSLLLPALLGVQTLLASAEPREVQDALSSDPAIAQSAIATLRSKGAVGLDALVDAHRSEIDAILNSPASTSLRDSHWQRLTAALDAVSRQRDDFASQLFWHTDFSAAKAEAKATGKPILSLRLLGKLDEDYSCANSRFFRTVLYANAEVSKRLRHSYILHWESVRPAPKVTIDFGDGRKLERTITGNSIHYVLDSDGQVIDAIPGLYSPESFLRALDNADHIAAIVKSTGPAGYASSLREAHQAQLIALQMGQQSEITVGGVSQAPIATRGGNGNPPSAASANRLTMSKSAVERPMLSKLGLIRVGGSQDVRQIIGQKPGNPQLAPASALDQRSIALMRIKTMSTQCSDCAPLEKMIKNFNRSIDEDTRYNESKLHTTLHQWFADGSAPRDLAALNAKVYAELFLTPNSDPWLGLEAADTYSALDEDGRLRK